MSEEKPGPRLIQFPDRSKATARTPSAGMIKMLQDLLERAHQGEFSGVAVVTSTSEGEVGTGWAFDRDFDRHRMLGGAVVLRQRLYDELY